LVHQTGWPQYRYVPQQYGSVDPRSQTEDLSDDPVKASTYALMNQRKVVPQLVAWTTKTGDDYGDLEELHGELLGKWSLYMGHVVTLIGGVNVDLKSADQGANVYRIVPKAKQKAGLAFLGANVFTTPTWLEPPEITSRIGPSNLGNRQAAVLTSLLGTARLARLAESEEMDAANAYPLAEFLSDLKASVFNGATPDANRRSLQRVYVERLAVIINPPPPPTVPAGTFSTGAPANPIPFVTPPNVPRSDLPAMARAQLRQIRDDAKRMSTVATGVVAKAHWQDIADRVDEALEPRKR
jgi:hypothetical protein